VPVSKTGWSLIYCGSKVCSGRVGSGRAHLCCKAKRATFTISWLQVFFSSDKYSWTSFTFKILSRCIQIMYLACSRIEKCFSLGIIYFPNKASFWLQLWELFQMPERPFQIFRTINPKANLIHISREIFEIDKVQNWIPWLLAIFKTFLFSCKISLWSARV